MKNKPLLLLAAVVLSGCGAQGDLTDLRDYIEETKRRPAKQIEPLPVFSPLPPFSYAASTLRSPFERPIEELASVKGGKSVEPDLTRPKEYLENFSITNMIMVGTVNQANTQWALIDTGPGSQRSVEPVTIGNYMGRNHGRVISVSPTQIEVMEIVSDGDDGWVERPRIIKLQEKE
ncbi:pilus assembly protein PilP [Gilvimarinus xylanilyticus]|uniref:Pilus assembly protein PilP n=1 Tax=Gilvimarinus xylanilyticus TaxID=2944139 RepID=A0A9X2I268_9GAMM|nr:pilus assembly protein PilP [Gilvimarinus xylanilyticus]MCP8900736.1 pilus assembly protein PilP [Gilvimarinus xylanilyticus]